jgi:hypothetical protein
MLRYNSCIRIERAWKNSSVGVFGGFGLANLALNVIALGIVVYRIFVQGNPTATPIVFFMVIFFVVGFLSIFVGLLAELVINTGYDSRKSVPYHIKERWIYRRKLGGGGALNELVGIAPTLFLLCDNFDNFDKISI